MNESNRQLWQESDEKKRKITRYKDRIHVLEVCIFAEEHSVEVLEMIHESESVAIFKQKLSRTYALSKIQSQCIADMHLRVYSKDD